MILIAHILIALSTVIASVFAVAKPNKNLINNSRYGVVATALSGLVLGLFSSVSIGHLCLSGLTIVGFCAICIAVAKSRLAKASI